MSKFSTNDIFRLQVGCKFELPYLLTEQERHTLSQQVSRVRKMYVGSNFIVRSRPELDSDNRATGYYRVTVTRLSYGITPKGEREPFVEGEPCEL